jgi:hypothetical protein
MYTAKREVVTKNDALVNFRSPASESFAPAQLCPKRVCKRLDVLNDGAVGTEVPDSKPGTQWNIGGVHRECDRKTDAALFADGGFEGQDDALRALKGRRDGIAASVNYWAYKIRYKSPTARPWSR